MKRDALVLERNLLSLEEVQPQAAAILRSSARSEELVHIKTRHGLHSIAARDRTLHSRYDPVREAMRQYHSSVSEDTATVIVFGLGAGFLPVTVLRQLPDTTVIAVERSWNGSTWRRCSRREDYGSR